jgi:hypothetical protein
MATQKFSIIFKIVLFNLLTISVLYSQNATKPLKFRVNGQGDTTFIIVDTLPEFQGGVSAMNHFLALNLRYPALSREEGAQGTIYVGFEIDIDGSIINIYIRRFSKIPVRCCNSKKEVIIPESCYKALEDEAIRVIKAMPRWKVGRHEGRPVKVDYTLPMKFRVE